MEVQSGSSDGEVKTLAVRMAGRVEEWGSNCGLRLGSGH